MRLGYYNIGSLAELDGMGEKLDVYDLSAVWMGGIDRRPDEECIELGEQAKALDIVLGEVGMWENLMTEDAELQEERIAKTRALLKKADLAGGRCVVTLTGTKDPSEHPLEPHAANYTAEFKRECREVVLRILDGLELKTVRYAVEPWHNTFFYQPEDIRAFIDSVDHPAFGLHLDQMNLVSQPYYFNTTALIEKTFDLLADKVCSVHLKDLRCDPSHMFLKWDEVRIGEGVMDYDAYLKKLATLDPDIPCYCEHFSNEGDYAISFARLHHLAAKAGVQFWRRQPAGSTVMAI